MQLKMPTHTFKWTRGKLSDGFGSMAQYLGLRPKEVVFINSLIVNPEGKCWKVRSLDGREAVVVGSVAAMCGPGVTALMFPMSKSQREYCDDYLEDGGHLIEVPRIGEGGFYPEGSLVAALREHSHSESIKDLLQGKVIANSYITEEVEELAQKFGGRTLMSCETFTQFLGKDYLHKVAQVVGAEAPPGIVVHKPAPPSAIVQSLCQMLESKRINPETTRIWIKPSSLSGGQGIVRTPDAKLESVKAGLLTLAKTYHRAGFYPPTVDASQLSLDDPFREISKLMPILLEADVGQLPWATSKPRDVAVNAILGSKGVVHIETLPFSTDNGAYVGSEFSKREDEPVMHAAEVSVDKVLQRIWEDGYRGYVSLDAMVVETSDGNLKAYVNDLNARLSASTPLVSLAHKVEAKLGYRPAVLFRTYKLHRPADMTDAFEEVSRALQGAGHLYRAAESGHLGIVPLWVHTPPDEDFFAVRLIALARDEEHMESLRMAIQGLDLL